MADGKAAATGKRASMVRTWFLGSRRMRRRVVSAAGVAVAVAISPLGSWAAQSSVSPPVLTARATQQMQALAAIKRAKSPVQARIDSRLYLALLHQRRDPRLAPLTTFRFVQPAKDGTVAVDIVVTGPAGVKAVVEKVEALGGHVRAKSYAFRRVSARVPLEQLEALAALPQVRKVRQAMPRITHKINT